MGSISFTIEYTEEELEEFKRLEQLFDETFELSECRLCEIGEIVKEATGSEYIARRFLAYFVLNGLQNGSLLKAMMK